MIDHPPVLTPEVSRQLALVIGAIQDNRLDDADRALKALHVMEPATENLLVFPITIAIQRGKLKEALQYIYTLDEERCPELKAVCLQLAGDPLWEGLARHLVEHSPHLHVRRAMQQLLGQVPAEEPSLAEKYFANLSHAMA